MPESISAIDAFPEKKFGAGVDLKTCALACIGRLIFHDQIETDGGFEEEYLAVHYRQFANVEHISKELFRYLENPLDCDYYLIGLTKILDLNMVELLTIALARAVEEDPVVSRVVAFVQAPVGGGRPTLGLLQSAFDSFVDEARCRWVTGAIVSGMAVRSGILNILNTGAPLPEQTVQISTALVLAMSDQTCLWPGTTFVPDESMVELPNSIRKQASQQALSLENENNSILVIRSASLGEARSVASEVCRNLQLEPVFSNADPALLCGLGALCLIKKRIPVFEYSLAPAESLYLPELAGYNGAYIAIIGADGNLESHSGSILQWSIPIPDQQEREILWAHYLGDQELARRMACDHLHSSGRIMQLARLSQREARLKKRHNPNRADIEQASWTTEEGNLGNLVQAITTRIPDEALVLPKNTREELGHLLQRCRSREGLDAELGITVKARYQMGVRALLVGPSGTGKTLVASWVATHLGLPLFRVDIASVVSKYIGETEKNLATLLAKAEQTEIVLLFDEADSLFGKRTDIKDSNDRHANSQTNYLLQRIEMYKGIVLLTSNSRGRFDSAFTRRLDKVIEFSLPAPEERRTLWQTHLGDKQKISMKQLNQLAVGSDLAGGYIRNAVLSAAVHAKANNRQISFDDIVIGLEGEYKKLGGQLPSEIKQYAGRQ